MKVTALKPHEYPSGRIKRQTGEEYEMDDKFLPVMKALGNVMPTDDLAFSEFIARDLRPEPPKKTYRRRDMKAE